MELSDDSLIALVEQYESSSYGVNDAELSADRAEALDYYNGEPFGDELPDRSQVVSRDVLDTIESALPQLLKVFVSGDEVVRFTPRNADDEQKAEQESETVNHFVMEKNDGFSVLYTWFKDGLLSKNGYVKVWYEQNTDVSTETYKGLTDEQLQMLIQDDRIEVIEHTAVPDERDAMQRQEAIQQIQQGLAQAQQAAQSGDQQAGQAVQQMTQQLQQLSQMPPKQLHDVKIELTDTEDCIKIDNVAPEDILVGQDTKTVSLQCANFVQHRATMTEHDITEQGWELPGDAPFSEDSTQHEESMSRNLYNEQEGLSGIEQYQVKDTYLRVDGKIQRLVIIGNRIVFREEAEIIPFACLTPHIMPHRHIGMSYADLVKDIQLIKSTLLRGQLDAMYLANQPRFAISDKVNLTDMLTSRPGGIVRVSGGPNGEIMNLQANAIPSSSFTLVEYLDSAKERRTGVTAYNQGLDANSLNKTATGVSQIMQATQQRIELVARTFANTGVKELFMLVHRLLRTCYTRPAVIRLRDQWVDVDPREWKERKDMSISVGLGTGNKDQQLMHLQNILSQQLSMIQLGLPVITPQNIYETTRQLVMNAGFKQPELFVSNPEESGPPPPPQPDPQMQIKQMELQADAQKFQATTQVEKEKSDREHALEMQKFQAQAEIDERQAQQEMAREAQRSQNDMAIEREKMQMEAELKRYEIDKKIEAEVAIAQFNAQLEDRRSEREAAQQEADRQAHAQMHQEKIAAMTKPKQIIRDQQGRAQGVE